jgi:quinol monooxygenase YgiN
MAGQIITVVSAIVEQSREAELRAGFERLESEDIPDGLLASALLRGQDDMWQITTIWRDRSALEAMRAAPAAPAAPRLFREVGAEPVLAVFELVGSVRWPL